MERTWITDMSAASVQSCRKATGRRRPRPGPDSQPRRPILDEPTAGLDPKQIIERAGRHSEATYMSSQHAHPARGVANLPAGRHHQQGPRRRDRYTRQPDRPAPRFRNDGRAGRRGSADAGPTLASIAGVTRVAERTGATASSASRSTASRAATCAASSPGPWFRTAWVLELRPMRMSLEQIFLSLTTENPRRDDPRNGGGGRP